MLHAARPGMAAGLLTKCGAPVPFSSHGVPLGDDGNAGAQELENKAMRLTRSLTRDPESQDFLAMVRSAEQQAQLYGAQVNRRAPPQSYRAKHKENYMGSKCTLPEWRNRSRLFVPESRSAVGKDMAEVAASLFNNVDF